MRRPGHRVFVNPYRRAEHPAGDCLLIAGRGDDRQGLVEVGTGLEVRLTRTDGLFVGKQNDDRRLRSVADENLARVEPDRRRTTGVARVRAAAGTRDVGERPADRRPLGDRVLL